MWLPSSAIVPIIPERIPFSSASVFISIVCIPSFPTYAVPANVLPSLPISCGAFLGSVYITFALYPKSLYASSRAFPKKHSRGKVPPTTPLPRFSFAKLEISFYFSTTSFFNFSLSSYSKMRGFCSISLLFFLIKHFIQPQLH